MPVREKLMHFSRWSWHSYGKKKTDCLIHAHANDTQLVVYPIVYLIQQNYMTARAALRRFILAGSPAPFQNMKPARLSKIFSGNQPNFDNETLRGLHMLEHHVPFQDKDYFKKLRRALGNEDNVSEDDPRWLMLKEKMEKGEL